MTLQGLIPGFYEKMTRGSSQENTNTMGSSKNKNCVLHLSEEPCTKKNNDLEGVKKDWFPHFNAWKKVRNGSDEQDNTVLLLCPCHTQWFPIFRQTLQPGYI